MECNQVLANTTTTWRNADCDGDGISNYAEKLAGTDPLNACDPALVVPTVSVSSINNICPATTANLTTAISGTAPSGSSLVWFTNNTIQARHIQPQQQRQMVPIMHFITMQRQVVIVLQV
jgi:hypothetical protein